MIATSSERTLVRGASNRGEYEEYHPYGSTAWWAAKSGIEVSRKRYRYTGQEKDHETGLGYHHHRYYVPWLGRWASADPAGLVDGGNRSQYARGCPAVVRDRNGLEGETPSAQRRLRVAGLSWWMARSRQLEALGAATQGFVMDPGGSLEGALSHAISVTPAGQMIRAGFHAYHGDQAAAAESALSSVTDYGEALRRPFSITTSAMTALQEQRAAGDEVLSGDLDRALAGWEQHDRAVLSQAEATGFALSPAGLSQASMLPPSTSARLSLAGIGGMGTSGAGAAEGGLGGFLRGPAILAMGLIDGTDYEFGPERYRAMGMTGPDRHHIFPKAERQWFKDRGVDIDAYTVELDQATHEAIHLLDWNSAIMDELKSVESALGGRMLTESEILDVGSRLMKSYDIEAPFVHYRAPRGTP